MNPLMNFFGRLCVAVACFSYAAAPSANISAQIVQRHAPVGIVSDWTHHHVLYPHSDDFMKMARVQKESRFVHSWYTRHPEQWWPDARRNRGVARKSTHRDWSFALGTATFEPLFDFSFSIGPQTGYGSLNVADQFNGSYLSTVGSLTVTGISDTGTYSLFPGGPAQNTSPSGAFYFDNVLFPGADPSIDNNGLLFRNSSKFEINIWSNAAGSYEYDDNNNNDFKGAPFTLSPDPGGGQTFPAKFVFDITAAPSCTNDYIALGMPSIPASGGQANILGLNNLYTGTSGYCAGSGPNVKFAYASGSGEVPADVALSEDGTRIAYIEDRLEGSSYFHVLTIGTTGNNGTSATAAVVPGVGNNATDNSVLLSPDGGVTNQSSTNTIFVVYTSSNVLATGSGIVPNAKTGTDFAYATTYSVLAGGTGYLYKISNVFKGTAAPAIVWSVPINAIPSTPVYDYTSNKIFFTDSLGRIDSVTDSGTSPTVFYGPVVAAGTTSENAVVIDSTNQMIYATFNSNGSNAVVVQAPTSLASSVSVPVGTANTTYTGPFAPDFNNAFYTGSGTPLMFVAGTGTGTLPTLYTVGFDGSGHLAPGSTTSSALATGMADSSPVTEYYDVSLHKDYLFAGVTNNCIASSGGTAGCAFSLDITGGAPTVGAGSTALAAPGGTTGIIVDYENNPTLQPSIYYATKSGQTLVRATQTGLN